AARTQVHDVIGPRSPHRLTEPRCNGIVGAVLVPQRLQPLGHQVAKKRRKPWLVVNLKPAPAPHVPLFRGNRERMLGPPQPSSSMSENMSENAVSSVIRADVRNFPASD